MRPRAQSLPAGASFRASLAMPVKPRDFPLSLFSEEKAD